MPWTIHVLNETVRGELEALPVDIRARIHRIADLMKEVGPHKMREPHVKHLRGKLWEIRASGQAGIGRALYVTVTGQKIVIVLAFQKKTDKTPNNILDLAETRAKEAR